MAMSGISTRPLPGVVMQHVEECAHLSANRQFLVEAPHVRLHALRRHDERLAAHLDGVAVAGGLGWSLCEQALEEGGPAEAFAAAVCAIEAGDPQWIGHVLQRATEVPAMRPGVAQALGWVSAQWLRGLVRELISVQDPLRRSWAVAGCVAHRVDPGNALAAAMADADSSMRAQALEAAGRCGRLDLAEHCRAALHDADDACRQAAAVALALLGQQAVARVALQQLAASPGAWRAAALDCLLKLETPAQSAATLQPLARSAADRRLLIRGIGIAGDPHFLPWLIDRMEDEPLAQLAGESFSMITGLDLFGEGLHRSAPEDVGDEEEQGDDQVALDEDEGLPWPQVDGVRAWWSANGQRFAAGVRHFVGAPPTPAHCLQVLRSGTQRQRIAAANWMCILQPGTPLFNTAAPAWRQQRWLGSPGTAAKQ